MQKKMKEGVDFPGASLCFATNNAKEISPSRQPGFRSPLGPPRPSTRRFSARARGRLLGRGVLLHLSARAGRRGGGEERVRERGVREAGGDGPGRDHEAVHRPDGAEQPELAGLPLKCQAALAAAGRRWSFREVFNFNASHVK
jgi:hypothetical protein